MKFSSLVYFVTGIMVMAATFSAANLKKNEGSTTLTNNTSPILLGSIAQASKDGNKILRDAACCNALDLAIECAIERANKDDFCFVVHGDKHCSNLNNHCIRWQLCQ